MQTVPENINVNAAKCMQSVSHWGYNTFHNVCQGTSVDLAWGIGGYVEAAAVAGLFLFIGAIVFGLAMMIYRDM